jgi:hypothetical protein
VVSFTPRPLYPREKRRRYPLNRRRLDRPQNRSGRRGEEKILDTTWDSNSDPAVVQPVAIPASTNLVSGLNLNIHLNTVN